MKKLFIIPLLFIVTNTIGQEQTKNYSFSLEQAIAHAITNNYSAINAGRDVEASREKKWETTAAGLPQINGSVGYLNNFILQKSVIPAEFFGGTPGDYATVAFGTKHNMVAQASLSQLLFDGSYIVALQASKTYMKYYENAKHKTDLEIRELVTNSYGSVLLAEESINILQKNKASLEKTLSDTKATFENGLIEEESVEQLQITLNSINSTLNYNKRLVDIAYKMLKITLGVELNESVALTDKLDNLTLANLDLTATKTEFNINDNVNYQIAMNFQEQRALELKLQKSKALPSLSANINYGTNAFKDEFQFFTQHQNWYNYSNMGINLNVPIFSSLGRSAKTQQAKIALDQANTQLTEAEQKLKLQFAAAKTDYEFSIEDYANAKSNLSLTERIEKKQQTKFKEGLSTSFELNEAQRQLYTAQQRYLQTMVDVINKKAAFEKITNK